LEFQKTIPTGIFGIENGIGIPLTMGVPEIGTKNQNSQPSLLTELHISKDKEIKDYWKIKTHKQLRSICTTSWVGGNAL
jgi:hypothetical protein